MEFAELVKKFSKAVETRNGTSLGECFTTDGVYLDSFYGEFKGRPAIKDMLERQFYKDGKDYVWEMKDPISNGKMGYARWEYFAYTSTMSQSTGKKVVCDGVSLFNLQGGLIRHYHECWNSGIAFAQLGMAGSAMEKVFGKWARAFATKPDVAKALRG